MENNDEYSYPAKDTQSTFVNIVLSRLTTHNHIKPKLIEFRAEGSSYNSIFLNSKRRKEEQSLVWYRKKTGIYKRRTTQFNIGRCPSLQGRPSCWVGAKMDMNVKYDRLQRFSDNFVNLLLLILDKKRLISLDVGCSHCFGDLFLVEVTRSPIPTNQCLDFSATDWFAKFVPTQTACQNTVPVEEDSVIPK